MNLIQLNFAISGFLFLLVIWELYKILKLDRVRKEFFASGLKKDFEQVLIDQNRALNKIKQELADQNESLNRLYKNNRNNVQKVGFVRFNPFDDAGGNISFTIALLDANDNGVVVSSLHGREGTRTYAKEVKSGKSHSKLTEEEITALQNAR